MPTLPLFAMETIHRMATRFGLPPRDNDDQRRAWTTKVVEQLVYTNPTGLWGLKRASHTRPVSADSVARNIPRELGGLESWDILNGSTGRLIEGGHYHHIPEQVFVPVTGRNWLEGDAPPPPPDLSLEARMQAVEGALVEERRVRLRVEERVFALQARLASMEQRVNRRVSTNRVWGHAHEIQL